MSKERTIGFIGQGYVGKNMADDFEQRGYEVVRYSLEEPYLANKDKIAGCDIVFIAVPTPTTPEGFSAKIVEESLPLVGIGKTAVIKSTVLPGMTVKLQELFPDRIVLFSPEFLREQSAAYDAAHPYSVIVGMSADDEAHRQAAQAIIEVMPQAPASTLCLSTQAEIVKYAQNASGYVQIMLFNIMYDLAEKSGVEWEPIRDALAADPNVPVRFANPVHKGGRGAGGHCLIKDFAALTQVYEQLAPNDTAGSKMLHAIAEKNISLLKESNKDLGLLTDVYGPEVI